MLNSRYSRFGAIDLVLSPPAGEGEPGGLDGERPIRIALQDGALAGSLVVPPEPQGVIVLANDGGCSKHARRELAVAATLRAAGLATLMVDLLQPEEQGDDVDSSLRLDSILLARRVAAAREWLRRRPLGMLPVGYFGSGGVAAAVLLAAAAHPRDVGAVAVRGGRPGLSSLALRYVQAPALLIVGEGDGAGLESHRQALAMLGSTEKLITVVAGASADFDEPEPRDAMAHLAAHWLARHLFPTTSQASLAENTIW